MHPQVWVTSGHVGGFSDPLVECQRQHRRFRLDELPGAETLSATQCATLGSWRGSGLSARTTADRSGAPPVQPDVQDVHGPGRGGLGSHLRAPGDGPGQLRQLQERPAVDAQENAVRHSPDRQELPQRDLPGNSYSGCASSNRWRCSISYARTKRRCIFEEWLPRRWDWYVALRRDTRERLRFREHAPDELAHYAKKAIDVEYRFPFGWKELESNT